MNVLIVDNRDSFTFNLAQLVASATGRDPLVVSNSVPHWKGLIASREIDAVLISPGPGSPDSSADFGTCRDLILQTDTPLLGVCLGHQGLGNAYGARVRRLAIPMHGRTSKVTHNGDPLFEEIPRSFEAVRYHSLYLDKATIPPCLEVTAAAEGGVPMALRHRERLQFGVQFHPESVSAQSGERLIRNFLGIAAGARPPRRNARASRTPARVPPRMPGSNEGRESRVVCRRLGRWIEPDLAFRRLFRHSENAYWLDSSAIVPGFSRFSIMGDAGGEDCAVLRYKAANRMLSVESDGITSTTRISSLVEELRGRLGRNVLVDGSLPFDFQTGLVGYFGYEMRHEFGSPTGRTSTLPDAALIDTDRCIVFDHTKRQVFLVARSESPDKDARPWFERVSRALSRLQADCCEPRAQGQRLIARLADGPNQYSAKIRKCLDELAAGNSYQICLSSEFSVECNVEPFDVYLQLRSLNPAPHAAFLRFGHVAVLSSSPERFLRVASDRTVSTKPIKGTCARGEDPASDERLAKWLRSDEKSCSENLIVVDLLRNDIGRVSAAGSVRVPKLMDVESYRTVHQLVSTVTGHLRSDRDCLDCLESAFPGGSMTGAPKPRTLSIIDRLEQRARAPYSGALGFLSYGDLMDLSIVIRTIVMDRDQTTVGAGGGIVAMSDPDEEFDEMILKAQAPIRALAAASTGNPDDWGLRYSTH